MSRVTRAFASGSVSLALSLILAACGGGGGGGSAGGNASVSGDSGAGGQQTTAPQKITNPNALPDQTTNQQAPVVVTTPPPDPNMPPPTVPVWTITDLTPLMDKGSVPEALNDAGDIAGEVVDPNTVKIPSFIKPFVLKGGQFTYLGNLGGLYGYAHAINNAGQIVGESISSTAGGMHAFSYQNGQMVDVGALIGTGVNWATAINQSGSIAINTNDNKIYVYSNGVMQAVPQAQLSFVSAINDSGQMAGTSSDTTTKQTAAFYDGTRTVVLGTLPGDDSSYATGMNNAGTIIGNSYILGEGYFHGFVYENGAMREVAVPDAYLTSVTSINNAGDIVGWAGTPNTTYGVAFLYRNGQATDLNTLPGVVGSGWTLQSALKINNKGQILVSGSFNGERRYALLTPPAP